MWPYPSLEPPLSPVLPVLSKSSFLTPPYSAGLTPAASMNEDSMRVMRYLPPASLGMKRPVQQRWGIVPEEESGKGLRCWPLAVFPDMPELRLEQRSISVVSLPCSRYEELMRCASVMVFLMNPPLLSTSVITGMPLSCSTGPAPSMHTFSSQFASDCADSTTRQLTRPILRFGHVFGCAQRRESGRLEAETLHRFQFAFNQYAGGFWRFHVVYELDWV